MAYDVEVTSPNFYNAGRYLDYDTTKYALPEGMQTLLDKKT